MIFSHVFNPLKYKNGQILSQATAIESNLSIMTESVPLDLAFKCRAEVIPADLSAVLLSQTASF